MYSKINTKVETAIVYATMENISKVNATSLKLLHGDFLSVTESRTVPVSSVMNSMERVVRLASTLKYP